MVFAGESPAFLPYGVQPKNDPSASRNLGLVKLDENDEPVGGSAEEVGSFYDWYGNLYELKHKGI